MTPDEELRAELTETFHKYFATDDGTEMCYPTAEEIAEARAESAAAAAERDELLWQYEQHQIQQDER